MKKLAVFVGGLLLLVLGWNLYAWQQESRLAEMAAPFFAACQTDAGCVLAPDGWEPDRTGGFYSGFYDYRATRDGFTLRRHFAIDIWLVAEGGKGRPVRTRREVE